MKQNTETPFEDLIPRLQSRARRLCRTRDEADDLTQETVLRLWQRLAHKAEVEAPDRYAMITLHNLARERWRRRRVTEELEDDMAQTPPAAPARLACADLRRAIARLPEDQADLMALLMAGEASPRALAKQTGLPVGTVMSRLARARVRLRDDMGLGREASVLELM